MEGAVAIDVTHVAKSIREKVDELPGEPMRDAGFTILQAPADIRKDHEHYYEPRLVSIGPFHRDKSHLQPMEERKWRYLRDLLSRGKNNCLETCLKEMKKLESRIRSCYAKKFDDICSDQFIQMMLLDGCFILELVLKWDKSEPDPMLSVNWCLPMVRSDLIKLENQIPFSVLEGLFDLLVRSDAELSLVKVLIKFLLEGEERCTPGRKIDHLLDLYHYCCVAKPPMRTSDAISCCQDRLQELIFSPLFCLLARPKRARGRKTIPCAVELEEAGVRLRKKEHPGNILDVSHVTFSRNGILEIPSLLIEETTGSRYVNLLLFEQCFGKENQHFSSYALFMDRLINTEKDVTILEQCGIIENLLSSEEEIAAFFNHLAQCAFIDENHYLAGLFEEVNNYCESKRHHYMAKLKRDYFSSPWSILSLLAAITLLILTVMQTYYAAYSYYHN